MQYLMIINSKNLIVHYVYNDMHYIRIGTFIFFEKMDASKTSVPSLHTTTNVVAFNYIKHYATNNVLFVYQYLVW